MVRFHVKLGKCMTCSGSSCFVCDTFVTWKSTTMSQEPCGQSLRQVVTPSVMQTKCWKTKGFEFKYTYSHLTGSFPGCRYFEKHDTWIVYIACSSFINEGITFLKLMNFTPTHWGAQWCLTKSPDFNATCYIGWWFFLIHPDYTHWNSRSIFQQVCLQIPKRILIFQTFPYMIHWTAKCTININHSCR